MDGQERTRRLGELEQRYVWDPLQRYLGPTGIPQRLRGALGIASMMDPVQGITGSMAAADRGDYGEAAIGTVAAAAPIGIAALGRRFAVPATRAVTAGAYDDAARALEETLAGTTAFSQALPAPAPTAAEDLAAQVQQLEAPPQTIQPAFELDDIDPRIEDLMELDQMYTLFGPRPLDELDMLEAQGHDVANERSRFLELLTQRATGWYDDVLSENQLRSDLRAMVRDEIVGAFSRQALEAQGVDPDDIDAMLARYETLRERFPDIPAEEENMDGWIDIKPHEDYYSGPVRHLPEEGIAGLYSRSARAAENLKQSAYSDPLQVRRELEARGAPGKELDWQMRQVEDLFAFSDSGKVPAVEIQRVLAEGPSLNITTTSRFATYGPAGGENYGSTYFTHPSVQEGPQEAYKHFGNYGQAEPPPLFHTRSADYEITLPGGDTARTHHVLEIQSDWAQHRQTLPTESSKPLSPEELAELHAFEATDEPYVDLSEADRARYNELWERLDKAGLPSRSEFDEKYPAPLIKDENDWLDAGIRQNLLDAVNKDAEWITFGNGAQANRHVSMPLEAAQRFYDRQVPKSVERVLKRFARETGVEVPKLEKTPFVDGDDVLGFRITPEFRDAMRKSGLPSFRDGGMVFATPEGRRRGSVLPATWPEGMTGAEALMSGQADFALPGLITEPVNSAAEALMTLDRIMRGEEMSRGEIEEAAMTLGTATAAPALRGRGAPNVLSAGGSGPKKPTLPPMPEDIARIGASRPAGSVVFGSKKGPNAGKVKTVGPAPEGFVPKGAKTVETKASDPAADAAKTTMRELAKTKVAPTVSSTEEARRLAIEEAAKRQGVKPGALARIQEAMAAAPASEPQTSFKLVSLPQSTAKVVREENKTPYSPRAGQALPGPRSPVSVSRYQQVDVGPADQYLEVPMSALERLGMGPQNFLDPQSRLSNDGKTLFLRQGEDVDKFLRIWKGQSRWFGLPEQPEISTMPGAHAPLLETRPLASLRAASPRPERSRNGPK